MKYTFNEVMQILKEDGWIVKAQKGSHVQMTHPEKNGKVTVPFKGNRNISPGTLNSIWKQAGLK